MLQLYRKIKALNGHGKGTPIRFDNPPELTAAKLTAADSTAADSTAAKLISG